MKTSSEGFQKCYNAQVAVEGENQLNEASYGADSWRILEVPLLSAAHANRKSLMDEVGSGRLAMKVFKMLNTLSLALLMSLCLGSFAQTGDEDEPNYRDQVQIMYVAYYGRPGDAGGLDFWAVKLEEVNGNLKEIINEFGTSKEFTDRFGDLDDEELVDNIFLQLLGRPADSGGLNFYVNGLREGRFTLASIALRYSRWYQAEPSGAGMLQP